MMNYFDQNYNFMRSMQHIFIQPQWVNNFKVTPPMSSLYSPLSSSTASFSSPIKTEIYDQEEPLNLSMKEESKSGDMQQINIKGEPSIFMPAMPLFMSPFFQGLFSKQIMQNSPKLENNYMNKVQTVDYKRRRSTPIKMKKSRTFKCNQCRNMFSCLSTLSDHTQNEHGGYKCHICETSFTQRSNLQRHALRHVGFKPYKCNVCCKEYYRKDHLIRHISFNHPTVNPKENIIQRLSSSESLNFIDTHTEAVCSVQPDHINSPDNYINPLKSAITSSNSVHSYDQSNDDDQSSVENNVFLSKIYDLKDEMSVDVLN